MAEGLSYKPSRGDSETHRELAQKRVDEARDALKRAREKGVTDLTAFQNKLEEAQANLERLEGEMEGTEEQEAA